MDNTAYEQWAAQVVEHINTCADHLNPTTGLCDLYLDALAPVQRETGEPVPATSSGAVLDWLRQDEPRDAFESGDSPVDYATHLLTEWDMYGPEGE